MASSGGGGGSLATSLGSSSNSSLSSSGTTQSRSLLHEPEKARAAAAAATSPRVHILWLVELFSSSCPSLCLWDLLPTSFLRVSKQKPQAFSRNKPLLLLGGATVVSLLLIYIRSVYRTIELLHGWTSSTMRNEKLLIGLDGAMMVPAVMIYNLLHPAHLLPKVQVKANYFNADTFQMDCRSSNNPFEDPEHVKGDRETLLKRA